MPHRTGREDSWWQELFQHDNQLNTIRCTQSSRDRGGGWKWLALLSMDRWSHSKYVYVNTLHPYPFRPHTNTIHQYSSEYKESTQLPNESSHVTLNNAPFYRVVQFILGGETTQTIQIHVSPNILACSDRWKVNSGSSHSKADSMENTIDPLW
jgi:hypothetical protein